jgi:hypothetical protein
MRKKLHLKGWSKEEIDHAESIFKKAEAAKHPHTKALEKSLFWFALIIGIVGTLILSFALIPVFIVSNSTWAYALSGCFGLLLGALIMIIIKDLHWMEQHHHILITVLIPIVALFNFFIVVSGLNMLKLQAGWANSQNPWIAGALYFIGFLLPYLAFLILQAKTR